MRQSDGDMDTDGETRTAYVIPVVELEVVPCRAPGCETAATATVIVSPSGAAIGHYCDRHAKVAVETAKEALHKADGMAAQAE